MTPSRTVRTFCYPVAAALVCVASLQSAACNHEWDQYLPPDSASATGGGGVGGAVGGRGGGGGLGGIDVPGSCPSTMATPLVKAATPDGQAICIDGTEVTRGQYETWLQTRGMGGGGGGAGAGGAGGAGGSMGPPPECAWNLDFTPIAMWPPGGVNLNQPVTFVDWCDAQIYCAENGKRLCGAIGGGSAPLDAFADASVSEWFSACSNAGTTAYPYGNSYQAMACNGSDGGSNMPADVGSLVGCSGAADAFDLSGNAWEWTDACDAAIGATDSCRIRGGGFNNMQAELACGHDSTQPRDTASVSVGFRCCADPLP